MNFNPAPSMKFPGNRWRFDYNSLRERWETYRMPIDWPEGLYKWLWELGHPGTDPDTGVYSGWDYHGGWIFLYDEKLVTAFMLRWS